MKIITGGTSPRKKLQWHNGEIKNLIPGDIAKKMKNNEAKKMNQHTYPYVERIFLFD